MTQMLEFFDDDFPCEIKSGNKIYPFRTDFRDWMKFEILMLDKDVPDRLKPMLAKNLIFPEIPPEDISEFLLWFYACGAVRSGTSDKKKRPGKKKTGAAYSFEYDQGLIFAAFMQCYNIDLCVIKMHWWKFRALFDSLSDETKLKKVMGYRVMEIDEKKLGADRAKHYKELKEFYKLPRSLSEQQKIAEMKKVLAESRKS